MAGRHDHDEHDGSRDHDECDRSAGIGESTLGAGQGGRGELVGPNGLLNQLTATVLEAALEAEMDEHLGYEKYQAEGRDGGNSRNGRRAKTVLTEIGPVTIEVPRDTESTFGAADRQEATAPVDGDRRDRLVVERKGFDHR